jgi:hypothetical protein
VGRQSRYLCWRRCDVVHRLSVYRVYKRFKHFIVMVYIGNNNEGVFFFNSLGTCQRIDRLVNVV